MSKDSKSSSSCTTGSKTEGCKKTFFFFNLLFTVLYGYGVIRTYRVPLPLPPNKPQGKLLGPLKFLTIWDLHFQLIISVLNVLVVLTCCNKLTSFRNAIHHGLSVPYGIVVASLFWSLYIIDRRLVFPKELDPFIPPLVNHLLHTAVGITPLVNEIIEYHERKSGHFYIYFTTFIAYLSQLLIFGYYLDFWIYPIFDVLSHGGRFLFIFFCIVTGVLVYLTHGAFHSFLWNKKIKDSKKKRN